MDREVKFRGKVKGTNKWVYGGYYKHLKRTLSPIGDSIKEDDYLHLIITSGFSDWGMPKQLEYYEVDEKTVGQYTGLKDKNGKEICEGDILLYSSNYKTVVNYKNGAFIRNYGNSNIYLLYDSFIDDKCLVDYEIIGNIYDNSELLFQ